MSDYKTSDTKDYEYFINRKTDKVYLTKSFDSTQMQTSIEEGIKEITRPTRIITKSFDGTEDHQFVKEGKELVIRVTPGVKQEIVAKFYEDTRGIFSLQIQKYTINGNPHHTYFTFIGDEIPQLLSFIKNIAILPIKNKEKQKFDATELKDLDLTKEQILRLVTQDPKLIDEILKTSISRNELIQINRKKEQLKIFENMLNDVSFFEKRKTELGIEHDEAIWQRFFEENTWILGYGLNYIFNTPLEGKKLEQYVSGHTGFESGKRTDALLKTRGLVSSLCFGEIKTHRTSLIKLTKSPYRSECWAMSDELSGGVIQIQKSVQKSIRNIQTKTITKDQSGALSEEELYLYHPKSFLVIGSLSQFLEQNGVNEDKFSSFELFRRNIHNPEIITFDELFERAKFILKDPIMSGEPQNI